MADKALRIESPLKGVNRAFSREKQPQDTCYDALNVMPVERYGRLRVGSRNGFGTVEQLGTEPVRLLHVGSYANTPSEGATPFEEPFATNGSLSATATWDDIPGGFYTSSTVTSNAVVIDSVNIGNKTASAVSFDEDLDWDLEFSLRMNGVMGLATHTFELGFAVGEAATASVAFNSESPGFIQIDIIHSGASHIEANVAFSADTAHTILIRWDDSTDTFTVYVDDVLEATSVKGSALNLTNTEMYFAGTATGGAGDEVLLDSIVLGQGSTSLSRTNIKLVAVEDDDIWVGTPTSMATASSGTGVIDETALYVSAATLFGFTYIVDGVGDPKKLQLDNDTVVAFTESGVGQVPQGATIACSWRGRLVLSGVASDPQNFFASKAGDPLGWTLLDGTDSSAFAGNAAAFGKVGQVIHALIPMSDDLLIIGCEQSIYAVRGDPAAGGAIDFVTDFAGISSSTSWTKGPDGALYFVGPRGFFKLDPSGREVTEISQTTYPQYFQAINRSTHYINCIYDADRYGIWIFVTPATQAATTHIFYDFRNQGLWPQAFTNNTIIGPISSVWWDGYDSDTRYPVLGGYAGGLYAANLSNRTDISAAISANVVLGPIHPDNLDTIMTGLTWSFGELGLTDLAFPDRWQSTVTVRAGKNAYDVTQGTPTGTYAVVFTEDRRTKTARQRLRGEWYTIQVSTASSGDYFVIESAVAEFNTLGRNRKQR